MSFSDDFFTCKKRVLVHQDSQGQFWHHHLPDAFPGHKQTSFEGLNHLEAAYLMNPNIKEQLLCSNKGQFCIGLTKKFMWVFTENPKWTF